MDDEELDYIAVLEPVIITDSILTNSTIAEPSGNDPALWAAGTNYTVGTPVRRPNHRIYRNLIAGTDAGLPENTPLRWFDVDSTNRWACLDNKPGAATVGAAAATVTYVLHPGAIDSLWIGGVDANNLSITVRSSPGGTVVDTITDPLEGSQPPDYYEHFFSPYQPRRDYLTNSIPPYADMEITVSLSNGSAPVTLGALTVGMTTVIAEAVVGCSAKPRTFATVKLDDNGNNVTKPGAATKDLTLVGFIENIDDADAAVDTMTRLLTTNCLWSASTKPNYRALRTWGLASGQVDYSNPTAADVQITVQGVLSP